MSSGSKRRSRWARVGVGVGVAASATVGLPASPVAADSIHHNISGYLINNGTMTANVALKNQLNSLGAVQIISMNEVCSPQAIDMAVYLAGKGWPYRAHAVAQVPVVGGACGNDFGAAVFAAGQGFTGYTWNGHYSGQTGYGEKRGYACVAGGVNQPKFVACTTHFKSKSTPPTADDSRRRFLGEYIDILDVFRGSGAPYSNVTGAGDLYLNYNGLQAHEPTIFSKYKEAGRCVTPHNEAWTISGGGRVDHIFSNNTLPCPTNGWASPPLLPSPFFFSDHRIIYSHAAVA